MVYLYHVDQSVNMIFDPKTVYWTDKCLLDSKSVYWMVM